MKAKWRIYVVLAMVVLCGLLIFPKKKSAASAATKSAERVIAAYRISQITGNSAWIDTLRNEGTQIKSLSERDRLKFYFDVLSNCELFAGSSLEFLDVVSTDGERLEKYLAAIMESPDFQNMPPELRKRIKFWSTHSLP